MSDTRDTIFALSSGALPAGVAVVRISGSRSFAVCEALTGDLPPPRQAVLRSIRRRNGEFLDQALVLAFAGPQSFTGEDCVELQLHGSRAVIAVLYEVLEQEHGCRLAEAGEFSRRAFESGKLDLVEVEGLADLLAAETEMQRRLAVEESFGGQSRLFASWRNRILHARAMLEAELDFSDEEDVPDSASSSITEEVVRLAAEMAAYLANERAGEIIRDGFRVVISGPPNSGKSSLINALANSDVAIVTDVAGTTRDVLHVDLNIGGYLIKIYDTAGLRETEDEVERIGIARAHRQLAQADLVLALNVVSSGATAAIAGDPAIPVMRIGTKNDLGPPLSGEDYDLTISTLNGAGLEDLRAAIRAEVERRTTGLSQAIPSRIRHVRHIHDAISSLQAASNWGIGRPEMMAESLRLASDALGRISGRIDTEEILGVIFSSFCIGK